MSDEEVRKAIVSQLNWDCRLDASDIQVEVSDGMVTLTGTVPTYVKRQIAEADCFTVSGVLSVENDLQVKFPERLTIPGDRDIRENIEMILRCNPEIDASDIGIFVVDGVISLEGTVDSLWRKSKAEDLAATVAGVVRIKNNLAVVPSKSFSDQAIADDILSALGRRSEVDLSSINLKVENGTVTLTGKVPSHLVYRIIHETAKNTRGVLEILNRMTITKR